MCGLAPRLDQRRARLLVLVYTLDVVLLAITATTLVAVALLSVRERIRDYGVLKTIGLTPRQIASSLVGAHAAVALLAALVAIPAGLGLYRIVYAIAGGDNADLVLAPWWSLALVPIGAPLLVAAVTGLPAPPREPDPRRRRCALRVTVSTVPFSPSAASQQANTRKEKETWAKSWSANWSR
jgi:ABC-type antimicrobial peptide transport system permease subunit